ncbi:MAG: hypothetical protein ACP5N7_02485 [Candidatus Pacearchaeota archaeon]
MAKIFSLSDSINPQLITAADEEEKIFLQRVVLASVDKRKINPEMFRGILFYPTEKMLRKDRLANSIENIATKQQLRLDYGKNPDDVLIVYLDELKDPKCKRCNGKGFTAYDVPNPAMYQQTIELIKNCIMDFDNMYQDTVTEFCKVGIQQDVLEDFLQQLHEDYVHLGKVNFPAVVMLAKHIREYMIKFRPIFCRNCVLKNFKAKIEELKRQSKFKANLIL